MEWKKLLVIFLIGFIGMCAVISVDRECSMMTGQGGKAGLTITRTDTGAVAFCFFGLEGEIGK